MEYISILVNAIVLFMAYSCIFSDIDYFYNLISDIWVLHKIAIAVDKVSSLENMCELVNPEIQFSSEDVGTLKEAVMWLWMLSRCVLRLDDRVI